MESPRLPRLQLQKLGSFVRDQVQIASFEKLPNSGVFVVFSVRDRAARNKEQLAGARLLPSHDEAISPAKKQNQEKKLSMRRCAAGFRTVAGRWSERNVTPHPITLIARRLAQRSAVQQYLSTKRKGECWQMS